VNIRTRSAALAVATVAAVGAALVPAAAYAASPWNGSDPNAIGTLEFFNSSGQLVTSGSSLTHLADYALAPVAAIPTGAVKATMYFAMPNSGLPTGNWFVGQASASTFFPSTTAPSPVFEQQAPAVTLSSTDANLSAYLGSATADPTPGWNNIIEIRVKYSGFGGVTSGVNYYEGVIAYNTGASPITVDSVTVPAGSWVQLFQPTAAATTTGLSLPSSAAPGANVTLNSTVSGGAAGSVTFTTGTTVLGTAPVTAGTASLTTSFASSGSYPIVATFTPASGSFAPSASASQNLMVSSTPPPTVTKATTMTGTFKVGMTVTCKQGTFSGTGLTYATAWYSGGVLTSDTSSTYPIGVSDYKKTLYCAVTATNAGGSATSAAVTKTVLAGVAPTPSNTPVITGTLAVGQTLALTTVTSWSGGLTPTRVSYKWERAGVAITGATKSTYKLVTADSGQSITCVITYAFTGYASKIITTAPVIG
jgi:Bacterial Ig-like domain (group 3)